MPKLSYKLQVLMLSHLLIMKLNENFWAKLSPMKVLSQRNFCIIIIIIITIIVNTINIAFTNYKFESVNSTGSYLKTCTFNNRIFRQTIFHKFEFWDCSFRNGSINRCKFAKADFYTNIFDNSYLQKINSS
jgi:uncharacterized protein YjbI with pentapeptide repeats